MGSAREWPKLSRHALDFHYIPSAMDRRRCWAWTGLGSTHAKVIAFNGDGCTLMNLGCLVTIVASGAKNLTLIVLDNGVYEVTGGQATAGSTARTDFAAIARAAGFASVAAFDDSTQARARRGDARTARAEIRRVVRRALRTTSCFRPAIWPANRRFRGAASDLHRESAISLCIEGFARELKGNPSCITSRPRL